MNSVRCQQVIPARFPDSEIHGSTVASTSPWLFAAVHVLHRLSTPRHPPRALSNFSISLRHASMIRERGSAQDTCVSHGEFTVRSSALQDTGRIRICGSVVSRSSYLIVRERVFLHVQPVARCARPNLLGGADRDRTDDLRLAKPALSQLSYSPLVTVRWRPSIGVLGWVSRSVGLARLELATPPLSRVCSNQLSYRPFGWVGHRDAVRRHPNSTDARFSKSGIGR